MYRHEHSINSRYTASIKSMRSTESRNTRVLQRLYNWQPVSGTTLLEISVGRGLGALKRLRLSVRARCVFFSNRKSYGPVRCGFKKAEILRCGSVRFSDIINPTARFGAVIYPTVRFGAVYKNRAWFCAVRSLHASYGAVRCGFQKSGILRCGSVQFSYSKPHGAVRCGSHI